MTSVLLRAFKLPKLLNLKLGFGSVNSYNVLYLNGRHRHVLNRKTYATVGYKHAANEERFMVKGVSETSNVNDIEKGLGKIDWIIKNRGRILIKDVASVFNIIKEEGTTSIHGLYLIRCCKYMCAEPPSRRIELAQQIWNRFQELGIKFDVRHYNALLQVQVNNEFSFDPAEFLNNMEEQQIEIDQETCLLLMKKYCKDGNLSGASEILGCMKEKGFPANEQVFNYLIQGHLNNNDLSEAKDMMKVMKSSNLNPTEDTYTILACYYAAKGDKNEMLSCLSKNDNGINMSNEHYLEVIKALAVSGNHQQINDMISLMKNIKDYRHEFVNTAVELIHKGFVEAAYKLIIASVDDGYKNGTNIFINQLIKTGKPISEIVHFSYDIFRRGINDLIILNATKASIEYRNFDCTVALFKERLAHGFPLRNSSFWSLFPYVKDTGNKEDIYIMLKKMYDLGIPVEYITYLDYVYPALGLPKPRDAIQGVRESGHALKIATDALFVYYCNLGEIDYALNLTQIVPVHVSIRRLDFKNFLDRYNLNNPNNYLEVLKFILEKMVVFGGKLPSESTEVIQGRYLADLILEKPHVFEALVKKFENKNFAFTEKTLSICQQKLNQNATSLLLLNKLKIRYTENKRNMSVKEENLQLDYFQTQNISIKPFLTERIFHHSRSMNIDRVSELLSLYEKNGFTYMPLMLSQLITLYSTASDLKKTTEIVTKLRNEFPTFKLDLSKILDYVTILTKYTDYDEALAVLKDYLTEPYEYSTKENVLKSVKRCIFGACGTQDVEFVRNIQNLLMPLSKTFGSKNIFLEPVINVHLQRKDLISAFEEYKNCIMSHHIPACLNNILKKCIIYDKSFLQKIIDLTINCVGRNIALTEFAVAFIETGHVNKAMRVIQMLGHEADENTLEEICIKMQKDNKLDYLEKFIYVTKSLEHIDRGKLYYHLLKAYTDRNNYDKAIEIFDMMEEEGIKPNSDTLDLVTWLPRQSSHKSNSDSTISKISDSAFELSMKPTEAFIKYLKEGDVIKALNELREMKKGYIRSLPCSNLMDLVDLCLQKDCLKELTSNVHATNYIIENSREVLKPVLEKYSSAGDFQKLISIANSLPDFSLKSIGFNTYFCKAFISCGKHEHLLSQLELRVETDKKNKMFSAIAFEELLNFPEFEERVKNLAVKYLDGKLELPIVVLWAHYFTKENYEKADEISALFKKQLSHAFPVDRMDPKILRAIRQTQNIDMGKKYISLINSINLRARVKERAYGALLDVLVLKQMYDDAVALLVEAEKMELLLHKYHRNTLITLKDALEQENKPVPFIIPQED